MVNLDASIEDCIDAAYRGELALIVGLSSAHVAPAFDRLLKLLPHAKIHHVDHAQRRIQLDTGGTIEFAGAAAVDDRYTAGRHPTTVFAGHLLPPKTRARLAARTPTG